ncbi:MAG: RsmD family RNA methyltransferase [Phycisphaerae bacterium]
MYILAGILKGRKLRSPLRGHARPITASVKKSLFGMLGENLSGLRVADLFCGTGTLGLEALSRGAEWCGFADRDGSAIRRLRANITDCEVERQTSVWRGDVTARLPDWLTQASQPIDLAFVDPPFADAQSWDWRRIADSLFSPLAEHLSPKGLVVLRLPKKLTPPENLGGLRLDRMRTYGSMGVALYTRAAGEE